MSGQADNSIRYTAEEKLLRAHDGTMALLYLHILHYGIYDRERAAEDLCMTLSEIAAAEEKLTRAGLMESALSCSAETPGIPVPAPVQGRPGSISRPAEAVSAEGSSAPRVFAPQPGAADAPHYPDPDPPEYTIEDVTKISADDPAFRAILQEARSVLGQDLNSNDLRRFCSAYHSLGLSPEAMYVLLHYCADISAENSRKLTVGFIVKQACSWANDGIVSAEQAEEECEKQKSMRSDIGKIKKALDIFDRKLTVTEEKYITSWIQSGFDDSAVYEAYDRAVTRKNTRSLAYIDGILKNWHKNGLHSVEEIRAYESSLSAQRTPRGRTSNDSPVSLAEVDEVLNTILGNR